MTDQDAVRRYANLEDDDFKDIEDVDSLKNLIDEAYNKAEPKMRGNTEESRQNRLKGFKHVLDLIRDDEIENLSDKLRDKIEKAGNQTELEKINIKELPELTRIKSSRMKVEGRKEEARNLTLDEFRTAEITSPEKLTRLPYHLSDKEAIEVFERITGKTERITLEELREIS